MKRRWVYWRSPCHGDPRILATRIDEDGAGYVMRRLDLPVEPTVHCFGRVRDEQWLWRISAREARERVQAARGGQGAAGAVGDGRQG